MAIRFSLFSTSGELTVNGDLDYEDQTSHDLVVSVEDSEGLSRQATITVEVNDVDNNPIITNQTFSVDEHSSDGTLIGQIAATAYESRTIASYTILSGNDDSLFALSTSGELTVNGNLDYEGSKHHTRRIRRGFGWIESQATITVEVNDIDDHPIIPDQTFR